MPDVERALRLLDGFQDCIDSAKYHQHEFSVALMADHRKLAASHARSHTNALVSAIEVLLALVEVSLTGTEVEPGQKSGGSA